MQRYSEPGLEQAKKTGISSKILVSFFFSVFALMGILFLSFMLYSLYRDSRSWLWDETPCRVISSRVVETRGCGNGDRLEIHYVYTYKKRKYHSHKFGSGGNSGKAAELRKWRNKYRSGTSASCFVNPAQPAEAVICRKTAWFLIPFMLLPLIFMIIGGSGLFFTWKRQETTNFSKIQKTKIDLPKAFKSKTALLIFFGIFLLAGCGGVWTLAGYPLYKRKQSQNWERIPCVITTSRVKISSGKNTAYSIDIAFRYKYKGIEYIGGTYDFVLGSDSDHQSKSRITKRYPPGTCTFCYVNPGDPLEAVLSRECRLSWPGIIGISVFVLAGAGGIIGVLCKRGKKQAVCFETEQPAANRETILKMKNPPLKKFFIALFIMLFWNGIISVFVIDAVKSWGTDNVEWFLSIFMIPFVLVGLALFVGVCYCFIALFNSRVSVSVNNPSPRLGEKISLTWRIHDSRKVDRLQIYLQGVETVIYPSGKNNSRTVKNNVFEQLTVIDTDNREAIHTGRAFVTVPRNSMHSFTADNTKIIWQAVLHANIRRRPDIKGEYVINVLPPDARDMPQIACNTELGAN
ncbi:MAG: DUF3592 domain-containing protein [Victivallales bacterium]|nr:DUF3592 domain-containing protein [Victivallales bacterium]